MARICFVSLMPSQYSGASEEVFIQTARTAISKGHHVMFSVPFQEHIHPYLKDLELDGAVIQLRGIYTKRSFVTKALNKLKRIREGYGSIPHEWFESLSEMIRFGPDIIYLNEGMVFQLINYKDVLFLLDSLHCPAFVFNHGHDENKVYPYSMVLWLRNTYINRFRKIYFISKNNLLAAERQIAQKISSAAVVRNMCRLWGSKPLPFPPGPLRMAMIARFDAQIKGHHLAIEALSHDDFRKYDWHLDIYGYGPDESLIKDWIKFYNLEKRVQVCNRADNLHELWSQHHVFLLPSLLEGLPQTVLESSLLGRPSLVTPVGDAPRLVIDGITGFVADGIGVLALRKALLRLFETPHEQLAVMGQKASEHIADFIDPVPWDTMLNDILTTAGFSTEKNQS